ncbi:MAG TPA: DUF6239 family natural product biosynthesis protein [Actinophytocola sp.]|uniref:DUF6239 family natural product biosynthesis protein n=1 Tax=Actinophytocola sp. TaxID=1872138 RepID=UPI002DBD4C23|nr:DUF6239 family natural product biosynthesis protein [Actinophytocola sp.]HEU5475585.1 DUF6239 family natural product biosynthesis protein [Actinophytocola sp.]
MGAGLVGAQHDVLAWSLAQPGHDHQIDLPVTIGPLILRVVLLVAVPVVAAFAMLRGFLPEPDRRAAALVAGTAAVAVLLELMVANEIDLPVQTVPLVGALLAAPMFVVLSRDHRFDRTRSRLCRLAPLVVSVCAALAFVEFVRALAGGWAPVPLRTGVVLALVGLAWFTICHPGMLVRIQAALLANAALLASAYGLALTLPLRTAAP